MEDKIVARNIAMAIGAITIVALALVTISTVIGNSLQ
jgi:hypothetical protein